MSSAQALSHKPLLVFDLDGTLADTRQDLTDAVNYTRSCFHLPPVSRETVTRYVGDGIQKLLERALPGVPTHELSRARACFNEYYRRHLLDHTRLYPGVAEMLAALQPLPCAVLSNKAQVYTREIVAGLGIGHFFQMVLGKQAKFPRKPAPDALHFVMNKMGVSPADTWMIGDTRNDILAGKAAGAIAVAVTYGFRSREQLEPFEPDFFIDRPLDLVSLVQRHRQRAM